VITGQWELQLRGQWNGLETPDLRQSCGGQPGLESSPVQIQISAPRRALAKRKPQPRRGLPEAVDRSSALPTGSTSSEALEGARSSRAGRTLQS